MGRLLCKKCKNSLVNWVDPSKQDEDLSFDEHMSQDIICEDENCKQIYHGMQEYIDWNLKRGKGNDRTRND